MASTTSTRSSSASASLLLVAIAGALSLGPARAAACGYFNDDPSTQASFDPHLIGSALAAQLYDPFRPEIGGCWGCDREEILVDWAGYLGTTWGGDWERVLFRASLAELDGLIFFLQGKEPRPPPGWEASSLARASGAAREKLVPALFLVGFARRVEPFAEGRPSEWDGPGAQARYEARMKSAGDPAPLQANGEKALARAKDPFLRQRYAFLLLRLRFHRQDWDGVVRFLDANATTLAGPSEALHWRGRYYVAGAHWRAKRYASANLELARIHAAYPPLDSATIRDFHPMEEQDWQATLALAKTVRERAELWQMVGLTKDALAGIQGIVALDPTSDLIELLAVREVNRVEHRELDGKPLEALSRKLADTKGVLRPWLFDLVAGHLAALRGDLPAARTSLGRATRRAPASQAVHAQARASLAIALAKAWRPGDARLGDELARTMETVAGAGYLGTAREKVLRTLAGTCHVAGLRVEAELAQPSNTWSASSHPGKWPITPWDEPAFIEALIARVAAPQTPLQRFLVQASRYTVPQLQEELARLHLVRGELAAAERALARTPEAKKLRTDPFVMHLADCHDCDHRQYASAPWTLKSFVARLAELERKAAGSADEAAQAAYALGSGTYNMTFAGNARKVFDGSHAVPGDTSMAERWFKRAHDVATDRELKARAATMAAKCELTHKDACAGDACESRTWYPALRALADTAYQKEVLAECGWYRDWVGRQR
jgi:hypothetical protein